MNVAVLGAGSWGTALSVVLHEVGHSIKIWAREREVAEEINTHHTNKAYLNHLQLPEEILCSNDLKQTVSQAELIVFAIPSHALRSIAEQVKTSIQRNAILVCVAKGLENHTYLRLSEVLVDVLSDVVTEDHVGVLLGPSHAEEVALRKPTAIVAAANAKTTTETIQNTFMTPMFRVYSSHDMVGVEIAAAVKNIIALAAGIIDGADFGDNAKAALITRGLVEIRRLGLRLGASSDTFSGLTGMGDLIVTCTSKHSRNRQVGYRIGKGQQLDQIIASMNMVAEGVKTTQSVFGLATKLEIEMPITQAIHQVLFENLNPKDALFDLMTRDAKAELPS